MIYNLYKQRGETPLECIRRFAKKTPELKGQKMTYKYTKTDRKTLNLKQLPGNHKKAGFWKIRQNN